VIDERFTQAAALFHQASRLLSDLNALAQHLPEPAITSGRPPDWSEARSYANCVGRLRVALEGALRIVMMDLRIRQEEQILEALIPPECRR
jgi:hypothetical protein